MKVKFVKLDDRAVLPKKATAGAIGYDLCTPKSVIIKYGRQIVPLGLSMEMPMGIEAKIESRSGFSAKGIEGTYVGDAKLVRFDADVLVGKIDPDFRGSIGVIVKSYDKTPFKIPAHTRIAQMTFYKTESPEIEETDELSDSNRGEGGFGSTGSI